MKEYHTLNPTKMKKTNEQLLEQCREELLKEAKELEHIRQRTEKQDSRLVEIWNQFEQQAALLALQRQSEAHDREMEVFAQFVIDTKVAEYNQNLKFEGTNKFVAHATIPEMLTKFRNQVGEGQTKCPECLTKTPQAELDMFGGLCEDCNCPE